MVDGYAGTIVADIGNPLVSNTSVSVSVNVHVEFLLNERNVILVGLDYDLSKKYILIRSAITVM